MRKKRSISEKHKIANIFNKCLVNITNTLNIPEWKPQKGLTFQNLDIILDTFSSHPSVIQITEKTNKDVFSFRHVLPWETYRAILSVNQNKSTSGTIPTKVLRSLAEEICIPLTDCINSAILNEKFPSELKMAVVIPIFKKDDPFEKANCRPISLLLSLSKVYEKLIYQQLSTFFENKLSPLLCGFRSRYSTQHALLNLINKWHSCLDNSGVVGTILMDLSKAFDCLPHELILAKLHAYGVDIKSLKLLKDYLSNRTQRVKLDSTLSLWLKILLGVPQGSILSPLFFNIFLNEMLWFIQKTDICNFADDNIRYSCTKSVNDVMENLQSDLKIALKWFKDNQMMANPGKFPFMILSKNTINKSIVINNKMIESSKSVKLLGLTIDNKLNFGIHINNICKVASAKIKGLGRIRSRLNLSQAKILYKPFILSQFNYCCLVWMFCSKTLQNKINQIQKRALRIVYNEPNLNLDKLVELDKSTTIHIKNIITLLTEVYKTTRGENPIFMNKIFTQKKQYYNLRITNLLTFPKVIGSKYGTSTFVFRATQL